MRRFHPERVTFDELMSRAPAPRPAGFGAPATHPDASHRSEWLTQRRAELIALCDGARTLGDIVSILASGQHEGTLHNGERWSLPEVIREVMEAVDRGYLSFHSGLPEKG